MASQERCPICGVSVKTENFLRHLDSNHPRHPEADVLRQRIRAEPRYAPRKPASAGLRIRPLHVGLVLAAVAVVAGAIVLAPLFDPYRNFTIDSCVPEGDVAFHIHPRLRIVIRGSPFPVPANVGNQAGCMKAVHTHGGSDPGTGFVEIHVESPVVRDFKLGDFFHVWGEVLTPNQVLDYVDDGTNHVSMTVDASASTAFGGLVLRDGQVIEIEYGPTA